MTRVPPRHHARGFTLIEVTLALVLSGLVLGGCLSVFVALRNAERSFSDRFDRTSELDITRTSLSRALLSLQMKETESNTVVRAGSEEDSSSGDEVTRPRFILETDMTVEPDSSGWLPQRFEVVCATPPVPSGLASQSAAWYTAQSKEQSLDFSALDGSQGITRGVFELRPSGERERIMQRLGLLSTTDTVLSQEQLDEPRDPYAPPSWTLWWRPILTAEAEQLNAGYGPFADLEGDEETIRSRLAGAIPLLKNIDRCIWQFYKGDEYINEFAGTEMNDIPAFAEFEVILTNSQYASWMFEIDWVLGDDPITVANSGSVDDTGDGSANEPPTNNGGNNNGNGNGGNNGDNTRPGGNNTGGNRFDFNGDS